MEWSTEMPFPYSPPNRPQKSMSLDKPFPKLWKTSWRTLTSISDPGCQNLFIWSQIKKTPSQPNINHGALSLNDRPIITYCPPSALFYSIWLKPDQDELWLD
jgi:hypothetical protein